jgi:uncharacterized protein (TIGR02678 family)
MTDTPGLLASGLRREPAELTDSRLSDVLDAQLSEQRRRAVRILLRQPLLTSRGPGRNAFSEVRKHAGWLTEWFAREAGWSVQIDHSVARLRKVLPWHQDGTRGAQVGKVPFGRRRYVLTCLALAALQRAESQVTLGWLVGRIVVLARADELASAGVTFTLQTREERADLVAVARLLLDIGVLARVAGDEQSFVNDTGDALYDVDRAVLSVLLTARRGPSMVTATSTAERLVALTGEALPATEDGRNRAIRHSLTRRLLDDPVLYYADISEEERGYLDSQRGPLLRRVTEATGLIAESRAEGIALLDPTGEATDLGMPEEGTDGHATLLLAEFLADRLRAGQTGPVPLDALTQHMAGLVTAHRSHWRKDATLPGADRALTAQAVRRLTALGLVLDGPAGVVPRPALARFGYAEPLLSVAEEER